MSDTKTYYCSVCGAPLNTSINQSYVFCQFCGNKNEIIANSMNTHMKVGESVIDAKTDIVSILSSAEYAISIKQYDKANELLLASIMSGVNDYRIYILKAKIDLLKDDNGSLIANLKKLRELEDVQSEQREVTNAVCDLMKCRGKNGVIPLHVAAFHEDMDMVVYCVQHKSDVNCVAGMNRVTPISIMFAPVSAQSSKLDGTPFIRDWYKVGEIRRYLMSLGAVDIYRRGFN